MARPRIFGAVTLVLAGFPLSALATTTTVATTGTTTAGVAVVPVISVELPAPTAVQPDWTYRFFIPALLVLAALVVVVTVVQYFMRVVRNRYKVVR
jgi:hypothetical protein